MNHWPGNYLEQSVQVHIYIEWYIKSIDQATNLEFWIEHIVICMFLYIVHDEYIYSKCKMYNIRLQNVHICNNTQLPKTCLLFNRSRQLNSDFNFTLKTIPLLIMDAKLPALVPVCSILGTTTLLEMPGKPLRPVTRLVVFHVPPNCRVKSPPGVVSPSDWLVVFHAAWSRRVKSPPGVVVDDWKAGVGWR